MISNSFLPAGVTVEAVRRQSIQTVRITSPVSLVRERAARPLEHEEPHQGSDAHEETPAHARRQ